MRGPPRLPTVACSASLGFVAGQPRYECPGVLLETRTAVSPAGRLTTDDRSTSATSVQPAWGHALKSARTPPITLLPRCPSEPARRGPEGSRRVALSLCRHLENEEVRSRLGVGERLPDLDDRA